MPTASADVAAQPTDGSGPAAPRRRLKAAERRARIVRSSMDLFARRGFEATRTRDIARAAGVSEAMVFKLFPDKESLYRAILEQRISDIERAMPLAELAESADPPDAFLTRMASAMLTRIETDPSFLRLYLHSALEGHPLAAEFDRARGAGARKAVAGYLTRRPEMRQAIDPDLAARAFLGLVAWFALARNVFHEAVASATPRDEIVRTIVAVFLDGVRAGAATA